MEENERITLSDGRALGYRALGDSKGTPLIFFHGTPGSRLVFSESDPFAQIPNVRLILPERPGYGLSGPKPGRTILDWGADVAELADHLRVESFVVAGESGGGPYALAVATLLSKRVTRALILCCPAPPGFKGATKGMSSGNKLGIALNRFAPFLVRALIRRNASAFMKRPEAMLDIMTKQMALPDRELLQKKIVRDSLLRDITEAYRQGGGGHAVDAVLATGRDWGFELRDVAVPVHLWHGEEDTLVTRAMAQFLARGIPNCDPRYVPGAGHLLSDNPDVIREIQGIIGQGEMG